MYMFSTDLTVDIDVAYIPPADFDPPTVNDFRAASGPVTLTCYVEGATGSVAYQWTSTCGNCFARGPSQSVIVKFLLVIVKVAPTPALPLTVMVVRQEVPAL